MISSSFPTRIKFRYIGLYYVIALGISFFIVHTLEDYAFSREHEFAAGLLLCNLLWCLFSAIHIFVNKLSFGKIFGEIPEYQSTIRGLKATFGSSLFSFGAILCLVFTVSIFVPNASLTPGGIPSITINDTVFDTTESLFLKKLNLLLIAPFVEEFMFRGLILNRWIEKWGLKIGIASSSILFGINHGINFLGASVFAVIMALVYLKTRSLWTPIICHVIHNTLVMSVSTFFGTDGQYLGSTSKIPILTLPEKLLGLCLFGIFTTLLGTLIWRFLGRHFLLNSNWDKTLLNINRVDGKDLRIDRLIMGALFSMIVTTISGLFFMQSDLYKSTFGIEPYKGISSSRKKVIDITTSLVTMSIINDEKEASKHMRTLADYYQDYSKDIKDPKIAKLAVEKSKKIYELADKYDNKKAKINVRDFEVIKQNGRIQIGKQ
jgi:uncharacterized protein